jgi:hypothetical protein
MRFGDLHIVEQHRSAQRRLLPEARPIVDHRKTRRVAVGDRVPGAALIVQCDDRHQMGEQRAARVELAAVDDNLVARIDEFRLEFGGALGAELGKSVAETHALERLREQQFLLRGVGYGANRGDDSQMILRDLPQRGIGRRNNRDHFQKRHVGQFGPAIGARHVDRPQAALGERVELLDWPFAREIALRGAYGELFGEAFGDGDRLSIVLDYMGGL